MLDAVIYKHAKRRFRSPFTRTGRARVRTQLRLAVKGLPLPDMRHSHLRWHSLLGPCPLGPIGPAVVPRACPFLLSGMPGMERGGLSGKEGGKEPLSGDWGGGVT